MEFIPLVIILIMVLIGVLVYVISSIKDLNRRMESFGSMLSRFIEEQNNPASEPENELTAEPTLANEPPVVVPSIPVMETPPPLPVTIATQEPVAAAMPAPQPVEMDVYNEPVEEPAGKTIEELAEEPVKQKRNFEKFIGENLFGKIGIRLGLPAEWRTAWHRVQVAQEVSHLQLAAGWRCLRCRLCDYSCCFPLLPLV